MMNYNWRYLTQITIEAQSAFAINSGRLGLFHDNVIIQDANGLPYIPGTSLAGVLRHATSSKGLSDEVFGSGGMEGFGSRLVVSPALLVGEEGKVIEGLCKLNFDNGFYSSLRKLPYRDHVKINERGGAVKGAKFDEELVYKGARFVFELELIGSKEDEHIWEELLGLIQSSSFRLGAGTRKGHGHFIPILEKSSQAKYDLSQKVELYSYLSKTASLNDPLPSGEKLKPILTKDEDWKKYVLKLQARDFFIFGAEYGDEDADQIIKKEKVIEWENDKPQIINRDYVLIPATSIKGALSHRVAFYYNEIKGKSTASEDNNQSEVGKLNADRFLEQLDQMYKENPLSKDSANDDFNALLDQIDLYSFENEEEWKSYEVEMENEAYRRARKMESPNFNNEAVNELFGYAKDSENQIDGKRGSVIIPDIYLVFDKQNEKVFNHVMIDRYTSGALNGALFQEKAYFHDEKFDIEILVETKAIENDEFKKAFEKSINDLLEGQLPLGGNTTKGHGFFRGELTK